MKTIRLPDPFPRGKSANKLEFGSSAWAADSCLVEWSRLEREWLGSPDQARQPGRTPGRPTEALRRLGTGLALIALVAGMSAWAFLAFLA